MTTRSTSYRADIDGLRAIAVLFVVLNHISAAWLPGGYVGVDVFFVISGYLISKILRVEALDDRFTFGAFYERRIRRLFPALFGMLAAVLVAGYFLLLPSDLERACRASLGTMLFSSNFVFWKDLGLGYFAPEADLSPLLHTWSLAVEEQFYLAYPAFLLIVLRYFRAHVWGVLALCAAFSFVAACVLLVGHPVPVFFLSPFRAWELLAGALLAFERIPLIRSRIVREALSSVSLVCLVGAAALYDEHTRFPGLAALLPVLGAAGLIHVGASGPSQVSRALSARPLVYVGLISYSLYLWHWPLVVLTQFSMRMAPFTHWQNAIMLVVAVGLGSVSYHLIERPFRSFRCSRAWVFGAAASCVGILGTASAVGLGFAGFPQRVSPSVLAFDAARRPTIPFIECDQRFTEPCQLGAHSVPATVVLWGDSHLIAWGPVLDVVLAERGMRAVFMPASACPPLFDVESSLNPRCARVNEAVRALVLRHREIDTVVMAAYWAVYFRPNGPVSGTGRIAPGSSSAETTRRALVDTLRWLSQRGTTTIVLGPVPAYEDDVPLALALAARDHTGNPKTMIRAEHYAANADFFRAMTHVDLPLVHAVDPAVWMCAPRCEMQQNGITLYRDANHLSVAGAMRSRRHLMRAFDAAAGTPRSPH